MTTLKDIAYNCRRATYLIDKKQSEGIGFAERLQLRYHLTGCSVCRLYQQQSIQISNLLKNHFAQFNDPALALDGEFKKDLKSLVAGRLKG